MENTQHVCMNVHEAEIKIYIILLYISNNLDGVTSEKIYFF